MGLLRKTEVIGYDDHGGIITSRGGARSDRGDWTRSGRAITPEDLPPCGHEGCTGTKCDWI